MKWLLTLLAIGTAWPKAAQAASAIKKYCEQLHWACGSSAPGSDLVARLANQTVVIIQSLLASIAVLGVMWGRVLIATSGAKEENRDKGKNIIIAVLIGTVLAILATEIIGFVFVNLSNAV